MSESFHRFSLSQESFAKDRIGAIKETVDELRQEHPEILSLELFGSLTKGSTREDSDIDGYLYIDAVKVAEKFGDESSEIVEYTVTENPIEGFETKSLFVYPHFKKDIDIQYKELLQEKVKDKMREKMSELENEQVEHLRVMPMGTEILDRLVDQWANAIKSWEEFGLRVDDLFYKQNEIKDIREFAKTIYPQPEVLINSSILLYSMFHLDVGGGIREYRKYLIKKLSGLGSVGEEIWERIINTTERREQKINDPKDFPSNKRYPRTLAEAQEIYG